MILRSLLISVIVLASAVATGCSHVSPYEREHLARPSMDRKERDAARNRFYAHLYDAREGATGTTDNAGGGCGCN
jgi:hypothetical protein